MAAEDDSIVDRAERVHRSLERTAGGVRAQAAVGGPCPECGERVELVLSADSSSFTCRSCGTSFAIPG
jgi:predicted RNA-binding Zn-ribbon protein involved in translation (DUF1610 family)